MSAFNSDLLMRDDGGVFTLHEPLIYVSSRLRRVLMVPAGFVTDLASIPRGLWNLIPKIGKYDRAAVVHDFLYQFNTCSRADADFVLKEAMEVSGVSWWPRWPIYLGVRVGGGKVWDEYRKKAKVGDVGVAR